VKTAG